MPNKKSIGILEALLNVGLGAGLLIAGDDKPKPTTTKVKAESRRVKPRRPGASDAVEVEEISSGEYLPKEPPVSSEAGFTADAWKRMQASKLRKQRGWGD